MSCYDFIASTNFSVCVLGREEAWRWIGRKGEGGGGGRRSRKKVGVGVGSERRGGDGNLMRQNKPKDIIK